MNAEKRICYFDLETQRGANEVGGWHNTHLMRMSIGVVYDSVDKEYHVYDEEHVADLIDKLFSADLVVGFNVIKFDYAVLTPYTTKDLTLLNTKDMIIDIYNKLGYRLSLNHIATHTLGAQKSADGLQALKWFKEGKMDLIAKYCKKDVEITRDVYLYGVEKGYILFEKKDSGVVRLPVEWER